MKFSDFEGKYGKLPVIDMVYLKNDFADLKYIQRLFSDWVKKGWLLQLKRGRYLINKPYAISRLSPYYVANQLCFPSYISLESALSFYDLIPEGVPTYTSVTAKKTNFYTNALGNFAYTSIKKELFWGFDIKMFGEDTVFFAEKEKALLDLLYIHNKRNINASNIVNFYRLQHLESLNKNKIITYCKKFENKKIEILLAQILNTLESDWNVL